MTGLIDRNIESIPARLAAEIQRDRDEEQRLKAKLNRIASLVAAKEHAERNAERCLTAGILPDYANWIFLSRFYERLLSKIR